MYKQQHISIEDWMEKIERRMKRLEEKLAVQQKPKLSDLGLINTHDLCQLLEVSSKTIANWRKSGELPYSKRASRYYYLLADVKKMIYDGFNDHPVSKPVKAARPQLQENDVHNP